MKKLYATLENGEKIYSYTIFGTNTEAEIITYGATLRSFSIDGVDVAGGFDGISGYITNPGNVGGTIGRIANRVKDATFVMDGVAYNLTKNNGESCLHGGFCFNHRIWTVESFSDSSITLSYFSPDGECGFPANLKTLVTYSLSRDALVIDYEATPDAKTPIALTNHAYFNLDGFGGDLRKHKMTVFADSYTEVDGDLVPTGNRPSVDGTVFDFREAREIGEGLDTPNFRGYDHNFVITPKFYADFNGKKLALDAILENDSIKLSVYSDQPGLQVYTGNGLNPKNPNFKGGIVAVKYGGICLETQTEPNSVNHGVGFFEAGEVYRHTCVYALERKTK